MDHHAGHSAHPCHLNLHLKISTPSATDAHALHRFLLASGPMQGLNVEAAAEYDWANPLAARLWAEQETIPVILETQRTAIAALRHTQVALKSFLASLHFVANQEDISVDGLQELVLSLSESRARGINLLNFIEMVTDVLHERHATPHVFNRAELDPSMFQGAVYNRKRRKTAQNAGLSGELIVQMLIAGDPSTEDVMPDDHLSMSPMEEFLAVFSQPLA